MANGTTNGRAHVLEISNRAAVQKINTEDVTGIIANIENHESGLNPNAHQVANIGGLQGFLDGKEPAFSKNTAFNKNFGNTAGTVCQGNDSRLSDARMPTAHSHAIGDVSGLQIALDGKAPASHNHYIGDLQGVDKFMDDLLATKADVFTGYTGSFSVVTGVNFAGQSVTTKVITVDNGIITSVV